MEEAVKDASQLYEVERRAQHAARPGEEVQLGAGQTFTVAAGRPHLVTNGQMSSTTFLVLQGIGEYDFVPLLAQKGSA